MENLCPVCNKNPLKGKQQACSSACRTAKHRAKQASETGHPATPSTPPKQRNTKQERDLRPAKVETTSAADLAPDHSLPSSVTERLLLAIAELRTALGRTESQPRIAMRTQITAQAPPDAVGYRLVLPHREPGVPPSFSPRRRNGTSRAFYSITSFQYPDDLRLCDGRWYRIIWIDSQGQQIRNPDGCPLPGLRFIVGTVESNVASIPSATPSASSPETEPEVATETDPASVSETAPDTEQDTASETSRTTAAHETPIRVTESSSATKENAVTKAPAETSTSPVSQASASSTETSTSSADSEQSPVSHQVAPVSPAEQKSQEEWASALAQNIGSRFSQTDEMLSRIYEEEGSLLKRGASGLDGSTPFAVLVNTNRQPVQPAPASWSMLMDSFPTMSDEETLMSALFSTQYWLLAQLLQELQRVAEASQSKPSVPPRSYPISAEEREKVRNLVRANPLSSAFARRCLAIVRYVRAHGASVLVHFPQPLLPISGEQRNAIENALRSPVKRTYMNYLSERFDAFLDDKSEPEEPKIALKHKDQRQIIRTLSDIRAMMYFRQLDQSNPLKTDARA